jgi:hypothetical protein
VNILAGNAAMVPALVLAPGRVLVVQMLVANQALNFGVVLQAVPVSGTV